MPGSSSSRSVHRSRQSTPVSTIRRGQLEPSARRCGARNARSTQAACATGMRPAIRAASGTSASAAGGAAARSAVRRPWISTDSGRGSVSGRASPATVSAATMRPASIGTAAKEITSSR